MSYSFSVTAESRADAKTQIASKFDEIVATQPIHSNDRVAAVTVAETFIDLLQEPGENQRIAVSMNGYLSYHNEGEFVGASVNVNASVTPNT